MPSSPPGKAAGPPERRSTFQSHISFDSLRRRGTGASSASSSSKKEKGPFQEHFSCYEGLSWEALKGYLERKWPHIKLNLTERKVCAVLMTIGRDLELMCGFRNWIIGSSWCLSD
ncbi:hypothetical protein V8E51_010680 [Hyaloscypha variabilis]|jgi:hypothetical protein